LGRRISKVDRIRSLLIFAKSLNFIRFSENSTTNFINRFAAESTNDSDSWNDFAQHDFGNYEISETKFFLALIKKVQKEISPTGLYDLDANLIDFAMLVEGVKGELNVQLQISELSQIKINRQTFQKLIKKLFEISSSLNAKQTSISANGDVINLHLTQITRPKNSDIFSVNPQKLESDLQINLLICYLLAGHNGAIFDAVMNDENLNCVIKLSPDPKQDLFPDNEIENIILSAMLNVG